MNLAVKFWGACKEKPFGMPDDHPWVCIQIGDDKFIKDDRIGDDLGPWTIMTLEDYQSYCAAKYPAFEREYLGAWFDSEGVIHPWNTWPGVKLGVRRFVDHVFG